MSKSIKTESLEAEMRKRYELISKIHPNKSAADLLTIAGKYCLTSTIELELALEFQCEEIV